MLIRFYDTVVFVCAVLAALLILFIMVSVSIDIVGRYFFNSPVGWVLDYAQYSLLYIPFLGMAWLVGRKGGHVRIDLLHDALTLRHRAVLDVITSTIAFVTCATAGYWAALTTWDQYVRNTMTIGIYPVPTYTLLAIIVLGLTLTAIEFARTAVGARRRWRRES